MMTGFSVVREIFFSKGERSKKERMVTARKRNTAILLTSHTDTSENDLSLRYKMKEYASPAMTQKIINQVGYSSTTLMERGFL
jgi:hypothetical protein